MFTKVLLSAILNFTMHQELKCALTRTAPGKTTMGARKLGESKATNSQ